MFNDIVVMDLNCISFRKQNIYWTKYMRVIFFTVCQMNGTIGQNRREFPLKESGEIVNRTISPLLHPALHPMIILVQRYTTFLLIFFNAMFDLFNDNKIA